MPSSPSSSGRRLSTADQPRVSLKRSSAAAGLEDGSNRQTGPETGPSRMRNGDDVERQNVDAGPSASASTGVDAGTTAETLPTLSNYGPEQSSPAVRRASPATDSERIVSIASNPATPTTYSGQLQTTPIRSDASGSGSHPTPSSSRVAAESSGMQQQDRASEEPLAESATRQRNMLNGLSVIFNGGTVPPSTTAGSTGGSGSQSTKTARTRPTRANGSAHLHAAFQELVDGSQTSAQSTEPTPMLDLTDADAGDNEIIINDSSPPLSARRQDKGEGKEQVTATSAATSASHADEGAESASSLSTLSCPICLGAPTPLALTACGHAFCAPCLHAALIAGPALSPPPPDLGPGTRGARGGAAPNLFVPQRGRGGRAGGGGRGGGVGGGAAGLNGGGGRGGAAELATELDKHCPVCRAPLRGGWGKSLRGLVLRMAPKKALHE